MKAENAIEVQSVVKKFKVYYDKGHTLKERFLFSRRRRYEERIVLKDLSFEVKKGEAIGLIGHNGCGKSTTLKLLTKIMYPDSGSIKMSGRVSSLIELGAGFHPDMSGRENIYINASIFGLTRKEIDHRLKKIINFSELWDFIDNPVRTYSSGMYTRLAFAVAINVDADILLIDEILAVGDANFQAKCFNKLREIKANGTTIVIVSHALDQIEQICDYSLWIHEGYVKEKGVPGVIHKSYLEFMTSIERENYKRVEEEEDKIQDTQENEETDEIKKMRWGNRNVEFTDVILLNSDGEEQKLFSTGEDILIQMNYKVNQEVLRAVVGIGIFRNDALQCYGTNTKIDKLPLYNLTEDGIQKVKLLHVNLLPGEYFLDVAIEDEFGNPIDYYREVLKFVVRSSYSDVGVTRIDHEWMM